MMLLDLDRADALHLAIALDFHARNLRDQHGVAALPAGLEQLRARAWTVAKGDSERHEATALDELVELLQSERMERLAYSAEEIGQLFGLSVRSIQRLIASGELVTVRIGEGAVRVRRDDLEDYLNKLEPSRAASPTDRLETKSPAEVGEHAAPGTSTRRASPVPRGAA